MSHDSPRPNGPNPLDHWSLLFQDLKFVNPEDPAIMTCTPCLKSCTLILNLYFQICEKDSLGFWVSQLLISIWALKSCFWKLLYFDPYLHFFLTSYFPYTTWLIDYKTQLKTKNIVTTQKYFADYIYQKSSNKQQ